MHMIEKFPLSSYTRNYQQNYLTLSAFLTGATAAGAFLFLAALFFSFKTLQIQILINQLEKLQKYEINR